MSEGAPPTPLDRAKRCDLKIVTGADPAAGAEVSVTVPAGVMWHVLSLIFQLVTSAAAATREVLLVFDNGSTVFESTVFDRIPAASTMVASQTTNYTYGLGEVRSSLVLVDRYHVQGLNDAPLQAGYRIRTITAGLQAGDDYGAPVLYVAEYTL